MLHALSNLRRAFLVGASALAVGSVLLMGKPAPAKEFVFDEKANAELAKKLKIPVYFAVPASARAPLPSTIELTAPDRMVDF
ncbi:hypothetical protein ABTP68_19520, partial [Acinetobacter baumannii]